MTLTFGPWWSMGHEKAEQACPACVGTPYPQPHACGGLLHASDADDDTQNATIEGTILNCECDQCGATMRSVMPYPQVEHYGD
jgi:hypothetical protein